jgi:hypothetical protein
MKTFAGLAADNVYKAFWDNNHFVDLLALDVVLNFGSYKGKALSFFFVHSCGDFQPVTDFAVDLYN